MTYYFDDRTWDIFYEQVDENDWDIWLVDDEGLELDYTDLPPQDCLNVELMVTEHKRSASDLPIAVDAFIGSQR